MSKVSVELTVRWGEWGQHSKTLVVPLPEGLERELMEPLELSDRPLSVLLASPGAWGGRGDAVTMRRKTFAMRRDVAADIARGMVPALMEAFGVHDRVDGYRLEDLDDGDPSKRKAEDKRRSGR